MKGQVETIAVAILAGKGKPVPHQGAIACARVFVIVPAEWSALVAKAAKRLGMIFQKRAHYGLSHALYTGYDTGHGVQASQGHGIAAALQAIGIQAYVEFGED